jgi:hypothetical protein
MDTITKYVNVLLSQCNLIKDKLNDPSLSFAKRNRVFIPTKTLNNVIQNINNILPYIQKINLSTTLSPESITEIEKLLSQFSIEEAISNNATVKAAIPEPAKLPTEAVIPETAKLSTEAPSTVPDRQPQQNANNAAKWREITQKYLNQLPQPILNKLDVYTSKLNKLMGEEKGQEGGDLSNDHFTKAIQFTNKYIECMNDAFRNPLLIKLLSLHTDSIKQLFANDIFLRRGGSEPGKVHITYLINTIYPNLVVFNNMPDDVFKLLIDPVKNPSDPVKKSSYSTIINDPLYQSYTTKRNALSNNEVKNNVTDKILNLTIYFTTSTT